MFLAPSLLLANPQPLTQVAILTPKVTYSSSSLDWLNLFLQEQIEATLRQQGVSVVPATLTQYWQNQALTHKQLLQSLKTSTLVQIQFQKVINQIFMSAKLIDRNNQVFTSQNTMQWSTPENFVAKTLQTLQQVKNPNFEQKQIKEMSLADWSALKEFYLWKQHPPTGNWQQELEQLEAMAVRSNKISPLLLPERASIMLLQYWQTKEPSLLKTLKSEVQIGLQHHQFVSRYHALSAQINYILGQSSQAKTDAVVARSKNKQNLIANVVYGLSIGTQHYEAKQFIRKAVEQFPPLIQTHYFQKHKLPQYEVLSHLIKQAWGDVFNLKDYLQIMNQGKEKIQQKQWATALQLFQNALQLIPHELEPQIGIAQAFIGAKQYLSALQHLQKIEQNFLDVPIVIIYQALVHEKLGEIAQAKKLYQRALVVDPKNFQALLRLSALLTITKNYQEAEGFLKTLSIVYPQSIKVWKELGKVYWQQGNKAKAKKAWQVGLRLAPRDPNLIQYLKLLESTQTQKSHDSNL